MIKIMLGTTLIVVSITSYVLYQHKKQQQQYYVDQVLNEAKTSLHTVQKNPYYQNQPIEIPNKTVITH